MVLVLLAATVVLPRVNLLATREDAEISKLTTNLMTVEIDIRTYNMGHGKFSSDLSTMTNVPLISNGVNSAYLMGANIYKCFVISVDNKKKTITIEKGPDAENKICKGASENHYGAEILSRSPISVESF